MNYLIFLQKLIALGDKLPKIFAAVQRIVAEVQGIIALWPAAAPVDDGLAFTAVGADEEAAELLVAQMLAGDGAFFDLATIRALWAFCQKNPWILDLLTKLFNQTA